MTKHKYIVYGFHPNDPFVGIRYFKTSCVSTSFHELVNYYTSVKSLVVTSILKKEQVHAETKIHEIECLEFSLFPLDENLT